MEGDGGDHGQGDALVGGPEEDVKVRAKVVVDGAGVELAELLELVAGDVGAGVHEERGLAAALERELAKLEDVALDHEVNELALVVFHGAPFEARGRVVATARSVACLCRGNSSGLAGASAVRCLTVCQLVTTGFGRVLPLAVQLTS